MKHKKAQQARIKRLSQDNRPIKDICQNCYYQTNNPSTCNHPSYLPNPTGRKSVCPDWRFK